MTMFALGMIVLMSHSALLDHAFEQWKATPEMRIEDAYKWLFHATLGGEHAVTSPDRVREWLENEWKTLGAPMKGEKGTVPLTQDGKLIRVNLRPYKSGGGDKEMLLWAFVMSAERFEADKSVFVKIWEALGARLRTSSISSLSYKEWQRLDKDARPHRFPAIHHSREYEEKYQPAYRVVSSDFLAHHSRLARSFDGPALPHEKRGASFAHSK